MRKINKFINADYLKFYVNKIKTDKQTQRKYLQKYIKTLERLNQKLDQSTIPIVITNNRLTSIITFSVRYKNETLEYRFQTPIVLSHNISNDTLTAHINLLKIALNNIEHK